MYWLPRQPSFQLVGSCSDSFEDSKVSAILSMLHV